LGGVRDLTEIEEWAVKEACQRLGIEQRLFALGYMPELTSKCIKAFEGAAAVGFLQDALKACADVRWQAPEVENPIQPPRTPLHIVYEIPYGIRIADFVCRFEAAVLLVDVFRASHSSYDDRALSLVDCAGDALSFRNRDLHGVLRSDDATDCLQTLARRARRCAIQEVIANEFEFSRSQSIRLRRLLVLQADAEVANLRRADFPCYSLTGGEPTKVSMAALASGVTVVFSEGAGLDLKLRSCRVKVEKFLRASVGPRSTGPAFVSLLHNEGLLAPTIDPDLAVRPPRAAAPPSLGKGVVERRDASPRRPTLPTASAWDDVRRPPSTSSASSAAGGPPSSSSSAAASLAHRTPPRLPGDAIDEVRCERSVTEKFSGKDEEGDDTEDWVEEEEEEEYEDCVEEFDYNPCQEEPTLSPDVWQAGGAPPPDAWHVSLCVAEQVLSAEDAQVWTEVPRRVDGSADIDESFREVSHRRRNHRNGAAATSKEEQRSPVVRGHLELEHDLRVMEEQKRHQQLRQPRLHSELEQELCQKARQPPERRPPCLHSELEQELHLKARLAAAESLRCAPPPPAMTPQVLGALRARVLLIPPPNYPPPLTPDCAR